MPSVTPRSDDLHDLPEGASQDAHSDHRAAQPPTGLVREGRSRTEPDGWSLRAETCPFDGLGAFDPNTGEFVPAFDLRCKNPRCPRCARSYIGRTFALARLALDQVDRARLVTFTLASSTDADSWTWDDWREARRAQRQNLRRQGYDYQALYVLERGSDTGRQHMHDVQHGSFIPKDVLSASWPYGSTNIKGAAGAAAGYLSKNALPYLAKNTSAEGSDEELVAHMRLNGGRAEHHTVKFFAGMGRDRFARTLDPVPGSYLLRHFDRESGNDLGRSDIQRIRQIGSRTPTKPIVRTP